MKTKEIEFWVEPDDIEKLTNTIEGSNVLRLYVRKDAVSKNGQMVKLIQEIPEKSITITEREYFELCRDLKIEAECANYPRAGSWVDTMTKWHNKLFKQ